MSDGKRKESAMKRKVCPVCSKEFLTRHNAQRYCSRACTYASQRKENSELRRKREQIPAGQVPVKIKIIKRIPVFEELRPIKGLVYDAVKCTGLNVNPFYIIPMGGKKVVIRADECVEVCG
ncbi:MAG: hypothetical protein J6J43_01115 [Oscillospiraceae bacterium]|nr:hypothetical protein [Oscillospiraceae bacterium]